MLCVLQSIRIVMIPAHTLVQRLNEYIKLFSHNIAKVKQKTLAGIIVFVD